MEKRLYKSNTNKVIDGVCGCIGVVSGRFYAMDRDSRWERLRLAYDALTLSEGLKAATASEAVEVSYEKDETDEFVKPTVVNAIPIEDGDSVVFANLERMLLH